MLGRSLNALCSDARSARLQPSTSLSNYLPVRRAITCKAQSKQEFGWTRVNLDKAARNYLEGLERGEDEDKLIARQLGAARVSELTDLQEKYVDKLKVKLMQRVEELKREKDEASLNFKVGKAAYEGGDYFVAVESLEKAVNELGMFTAIGGEAAMWLALAYNAVGREEECIDMCKQLEEGHPAKKVKREAANLRYIMEAPKLKLSEDERVTIPLLSDAEPNRRTGKTVKRFPTPTGGASKPIQKSYLDDLLNLPPMPLLPPNRFAQVAWITLIVGTTFYINYKYSRGEL